MSKSTAINPPQRKRVRHGALAAAIAVGVLALPATPAHAADPSESAACHHSVFQGLDRPGNEQNAYVGPADGTNRIVPTRLTGLEQVRSPILMNGGDQLLFTAVVDNVSRVHIMDLPAGTPEMISGDGPDDPASNENLAATRDGTRVAWTGVGPDADGIVRSGQVYVANADGTERVHLSPVTASAASRLEFSPDGSRLAWTGRLGGARRLFVADLTRLTDPDFVVTARTSREGVVASGSLAWSPSGAEVAFETDSPSRRAVMIADAATGLSVDLADNIDLAGIASPTWTADGRRIGAVATNADGEHHVVLVDRDEELRSFEQVTADPLTDRNVEVAISPDGSEIAWTTAPGGTKTLIRTTTAARPSERIFEIVRNSLGINDVRWAIDGSISWREGTAGDPEVRTMPAGETDTVELSRSIIVEGPVGLFTDDPELNFHNSWSPAFTTLDVAVEDTEDRLDVRIANTGTCTASVTLTAPPTCPLRDGEGINSGAGVVGYGRVEPGDTVVHEISLAGACNGVIHVVAPNATPTAVFVGEAEPAPGPQPEPEPDPNDETPEPNTPTPQGQAPDGNQLPCPTDPAPFTDVEDTFADADVDCLYGLEITTGTSPTTYSPNDNVTRLQMAAFIARTWRAAGGECPTDPAPFTDVEDTFADADVDCLYGLEITTGTSPTTYSPNDNVTRLQMAAFIARTWRAAGGECPTDPAPFTDVEDTFADADVDCLYGLEITTGTSPTSYSPNDNVTRLQMAAFIARTWEAMRTNG